LCDGYGVTYPLDIVIVLAYAGYPLRLEKLEVLEKLEIEPFSEFGWKSWKTIGFSPAVAGKAGILILGLMIINGIIR